MMTKLTNWIAVGLLFCAAGSTRAADGTWTSSSSANWNAGASWLDGTIPGSTSADNPDIANFTYLAAGTITVTVDANRYIGGITLGNGASYTLQTGTLRLNNGGVIQAQSGAASSSVTAPVVIRGTSAATATFTADSANTLTLGAVTGSATAGNTTTLTLNGTGTGGNAISGVIGNGTGGGALAVVKSGTGTWKLSTAANTYSGGTTISDGTLTTYAANNGNGDYFHFGTGTVTLNNATWVATAQYASRTFYFPNSFVLDGATVNFGGFAPVHFGMSSAGTRSTIDVSGGGGTLQMSGGQQYFDGQLTGSGTLTFPTTSPYVLHFTSDNNSCSGTVKIGGAQNKSITLSLEAANALQYATVTLDGTAAAYSLMLLNTAGTYTIAGLTGLGTVQPNAAGAYTLLVNNAVGNSFSGLLKNNTGTLALTKAGAGTLTLSGDNPYTGVTTINAGTLSVAKLANGGAVSHIGQSTSVAGNLVLNGGALQFTGTANGSTDRLFTLGDAGGTLDASGTVAMNFSNTGAMGFTGTTAARTLTLTGTSTAANTLAAAFGDNTGATSLTKSGAGTWVLSGSKAYSGSTTISNGTLALSSSGSIGSSATLNIGAPGIFDVSAVSGYTLNNGQTLQGNGTVVGSVTVASGAHVAPGNNGIGTLNAGSSLTLNSGSSLDIEISGATSDQLIVGGGTGTFAINSPTTLNLYQAGSATLWTPTGAGTFPLVHYGGSLANPDHATLNFTPSPGFDVTLINDSNWLTLNVVATAGTPEWTATSPGNWSLPGNWSTPPVAGSTVNFGTGTASGSITLDADPTLKIMNFRDVNTTLGGSGHSITLDNSGGSATISATLGNTHTIASGVNLTLNDNADLAISGGLTIGGTIADGANGARGIAKAGSGTLTLSGNNSYGGGTAISAGTLAVGHDHALGNGAALTFTGAGTLQTAADGLTLSSAVLTLNAAATVDTIGNTFTLSGTLGGGSGLTKSGAGTLILTGDNGYTGGTTIDGGTLTLGGAGRLGNGTYAAPIANQGTLVCNSSSNQTLSGIISGSGSLTMSGSGTLTLSNNGNTYAGGTTISSGTINATVAKSFGTGTVTMNGGTLLPNSATFTNSFVFNGGLVQGIAHIGTSASTITLGAGGLTAKNEWDGTVYLDGLLTGSGPLTVSHIGAAGNNSSRVRITHNDNTYSGTVTVQATAANKYNGLYLDAANALQHATVTFTAGTITGLMILNAPGTTYAIAGLTGSVGVVQPNTTAGTYTLSVSNAVSNSFAGVLKDFTGVLALTKTGNGTLTLAGANTYSGATVVNAGTLQMASGGTIAGTNITVESGATLAIAAGAGANTLSTSAWLNLNGTGKVQQNSATVQDVGHLLFAGAAQPRGTWGATGSGAQWINDVHFSGTGKVQVLNGMRTRGTLLIFR